MTGQNNFLLALLGRFKSFIFGIIFIFMDLFLLKWLSNKANPLVSGFVFAFPFALLEIIYIKVIGGKSEKYLDKFVLSAILGLFIAMVTLLFTGFKYEKWNRKIVSAIFIYTLISICVYFIIHNTPLKSLFL